MLLCGTRMRVVAGDGVYDLAGLWQKCSCVAITGWFLHGDGMHGVTGRSRVCCCEALLCVNVGLDSTERWKLSHNCTYACIYP